MTKKSWTPQVGDWVSIPWWEAKAGEGRAKRVRNLTGQIISINGYCYVQIKDNPKYDVLELYPDELKKRRNAQRKLRAQNPPRKR